METLLEQATRRLREAMNRYGFKDADLGHATDGSPCWCGPERICAWCLTAAPCIHGTARREVVIHKQAT